MPIGHVCEKLNAIGHHHTQCIPRSTLLDRFSQLLVNQCVVATNLEHECAIWLLHCFVSQVEQVRVWVIGAYLPNIGVFLVL